MFKRKTDDGVGGNAQEKGSFLTRPISFGKNKDSQENSKLKQRSLSGRGSRGSEDNSAGTSKKGMAFGKSKERKVRSGANKPLYKKKGNNFVSIDLGNYMLKIVVGNFQGDHIKIVKAFRTVLPDSVYVDGMINDEKKFIDIVKRELEMNRVKDVDIIVTFDSTLIIKRRMTVPILSDLETKQLVSFELEEYLGINAEEYIIQYQILAEYDQQGQKRDIQIDAVPKALARKIYSAFRQNGYNPCILGIQSSFLENFMRDYGVNGENFRGEGSVAIADIGNSGIVINVFRNGKKEFNRIIKSTSSIRLALMKGLGTDDSMALATLQGYMRRGADFESTLGGQDDQASAIIKSTVDSWITEIDRSLEFYRSRSIDNNIEKLYIYGGDTAISGIDRYIEKRLHLPTETIRKFRNLEVAKDIDPSELSNYVNSISALIRG